MTPLGCSCLVFQGNMDTCRSPPPPPPRRVSPTIDIKYHMYMYMLKYIMEKGDVRGVERGVVEGVERGVVEGVERGVVEGGWATTGYSQCYMTASTSPQATNILILGLCILS